MPSNEAGLKSDILRLFQLGFVPSQLPLLGLERGTAQRYYREWRAGGGTVAPWRRLVVRLVLRSARK